MRRPGTIARRCAAIVLAAAAATQAAQAYKMCNSITPEGKAPSLAKLKKEIAVNYGDQYAAKAMELLQVLDDASKAKVLPEPERLSLLFDVLYAYSHEAYKQAHSLRKFLNSSGVQCAGSKAAPALRSKVDWYKVCFTATKPWHVYVFQLDSTGKIDPLFPNDNILPGQANPVKANVDYQAPPLANWAFLDENVGVEKIYLFASQKRKPEVEALFPYFIKASKQILNGSWKRVSPQGKASPLPPKFKPMVEVAVVTRGLPRGMGGITGPTKLADMQGQFTTPYTATLYVAEQDEFVQTLWFRHK